MVNAGETKLIEMTAPTLEITWYRGDSKERAANDVSFTHVRCQRAGNGAILWTFFKVDPR